MITLSVDDQKDITELMKMMLTNIDPNGKHMTASNMEEAFDLLSDDVQILFLDIEMPGINGIEGAKKLKQMYNRLNIIYVTGHPEYVLDAIGVHPSGILIKPVTEQDILHELQELRFPIEQEESRLRVQCDPFAVFLDNENYTFKRGKTMELFAYLVYKNGAFCTHGELLGVLWDGDPDKKGYLRQLILDLGNSLKEIGVEEVIEKKYGKIGINMSALQFTGKPARIALQFGWI
ncbi:MAG: response regulator [Oscillospiraceae bacterium]|nr:response regulator [Oscillospiraceae bacterium]